MRRLVAASALLTLIALAVPSYGAINSGHYVLIYKGTLKATKTVYLHSDVNNLLSGTTQGYWAVDINDANEADADTYGSINDVNAVLFDTKDKVFEVVSGDFDMGQHDPRKAEFMAYATGDVNGTGDVNSGRMMFYVLGKGKLTQIYNTNRTDANTLVKKYVPAGMNGFAYFDHFNFFSERYDGVGATTLTLDAKLTKQYNSAGYTVDQAINDIVSTKLKNLTKIPYIYSDIY